MFSWCVRECVSQYTFRSDIINIYNKEKIMIHPLGIISLITTADKYDDVTFNKRYSIFCHKKIIDFVVIY